MSPAPKPVLDLELLRTMESQGPGSPRRDLLLEVIDRCLKAEAALAAKTNAASLPYTVTES